MRNVRTEIDGIKFQSKKEGKRYIELKLLQKGSYIRDLVVQPKAYIIIDKKFNVNTNRHITFRPDFSYTKSNGHFVIEDVKGRKAGTQYRLFLLKKCLMKQIYNIDVIEI